MARRFLTTEKPKSHFCVRLALACDTRSPAGGGVFAVVAPMSTRQTCTSTYILVPISLQLSIARYYRYCISHSTTYCSVFSVHVHTNAAKRTASTHSIFFCQRAQSTPALSLLPAQKGYSLERVSSTVAGAQHRQAQAGARAREHAATQQQQAATQYLPAVECIRSSSRAILLFPPPP
jgi:hypothetical protein